MEPMTQINTVVQLPEYLAAKALVKCNHLAEASEMLGKLMHGAS